MINACIGIVACSFCNGGARGGTISDGIASSRSFVASLSPRLALEQDSYRFVERV